MVVAFAIDNPAPVTRQAIVNWLKNNIGVDVDAQGIEFKFQLNVADPSKVEYIEFDANPTQAQKDQILTAFPYLKEVTPRG